MWVSRTWPGRPGRLAAGPDRSSPDGAQESRACGLKRLCGADPGRPPPPRAPEPSRRGTQSGSELEGTRGGLPLRMGPEDSLRCWPPAPGPSSVCVWARVCACTCACLRGSMGGVGVWARVHVLLNTRVWGPEEKGVGGAPGEQGLPWARAPDPGKMALPERPGRPQPPSGCLLSPPQRPLSAPVTEGPEPFARVTGI